MKLALFKNTQYSFGDSAACEAVMENCDGYARVSEYVEVDFPPLSDEAAIQQQLGALDRTERELREKFQQHLDGIKSRRAELLALTHMRVAGEL